MKRKNSPFATDFVRGISLPRVYPFLCALVTVAAALLWSFEQAYAQEEPVEFQFKFGSKGSGDGKFTQPHGVAVDSLGRIIVADSDNHRIQVFDSVGVFLFDFGSHGSTDGQLRSPRGVAVNSSDSVIVADTWNSRIQGFDSQGNFLFKLGPFGGSHRPEGLAVDSLDRIIVPDVGNHRIQIFDAAGEFLFQFGREGRGDGEFHLPWGVAVDSRDRIVVADSVNARIQVFDSAGGFRFCSSIPDQGRYEWPADVAVDSDDRIIVAIADTGCNDPLVGHLEVFDSTGRWLFKVGTPGSADGQFSFPNGVAVDRADRVVVADTYNDRLQVFAFEKRFLRGECNDDGEVDLSDAVCTLNWLFSDVVTPRCIAALNSNGDADVDVSDPVTLLNFLFDGGPSPASPFPDCGTWTVGADRDLGCETPLAVCRP